MGSAGKAVATGGLSLVEDSGALSTGKSAADRAQKRQAKAIAERQKKEDALLAEADSEVAKRKALGTKSRAGRKSLIATSNTGLATNLGGSE
jgi:hypothetical protein